MDASSRPDRCGSHLGSCCGPRACRLCCPFCPAVNESTSTRLVYSGMLLLATLLMASLLLPGIQEKLQVTFRDFNATCIDLKIGDNCMKLTGYMAIYKVSFAFGSFFILMSFFTLGVNSSRGARAAVHNGFWFFKLVVMAALVVAIFVIPISHLDDVHTGWIYATLMGNCVFIWLQMVCLLDCSASICATLQRLTSRHRWFRALELTLAIALLSLWLAMAIVIFISHGRQEYCLTKHLIIIFNTGFCITLVLAALTPCATSPTARSLFMTVIVSGCASTPPPPPPHTPPHHDRFDGPTYSSRLLQAGVVVVYITYWVWSGMTSCPESPGMVERLTFLMDEDDLACHVHSTQLTQDGLLGASTVMMLITLMYVGSEARAAAKADLHHHQPAPAFPITTAVPSSVLITSTAPPPEDKGGQRLIRNERSEAAYSYASFHFLMALAVMYVTAQLTRWFQPREYKSLDLDKSWQTVGMKIGIAWVCGLAYLLHLLLPNRCCCCCCRRPGQWRPKATPTRPAPAPRHQPDNSATTATRQDQGCLLPFSPLNPDQVASLECYFTGASAPGSGNGSSHI